MGRPLKKRGSATRPAARRPDASGRHDELVAVAGTVFAQRGIGNTTMRDIADEAGILAGSLYHHFVSKDALLDEVLRGPLTTLTGQYQNVSDTNSDPIDALRQLLLTALRFVVSEYDVTSIVQNDHTYLHDMADFQFVAKISDAHAKIWLEVLRAGIAAGVFRSTLDPELVYRSMMGSITSMVRWYEPTRARSIDDLAESYTELYLHGTVVNAVPTTKSGQRSAAVKQKVSARSSGGTGSPRAAARGEHSAKTR